MNSTNPTIDHILSDIASLSPADKEEIFGMLETMKTDSETEKRKPSQEIRISDLWGVGAELWRDESVEDYIRKERDSWD